MYEIFEDSPLPAFQDVLLRPRYSTIRSRSEVDLSTYLGRGVRLSLPIVSSPMDTVTDGDMALQLAKHGGLGIIHRYLSVEAQARGVAYVSLSTTLPATHKHVGAAIGMTGQYNYRADECLDAGATVICVDVAHGYHETMRRCLQQLRSQFPDAHIMAGNVATGEAYAALSAWGADSVRVGIGGGSICTTRIKTGHGLPTFTSVIDCYSAKKQLLKEHLPTATIIADGGIKTPGDIVKALAAGADAVMLGSMLSGTVEAPGRVIYHEDGSMYKEYRGMASRESQMQWRGESSSPEGVAATVPYKGSVEDILKDIAGNVRSGLSYSGARNIAQLRENAQWIRQTGASQVESSAHIFTLPGSKT